MRTGFPIAGLFLGCWLALAQNASEIPVTGVEQPQLRAFDEAVLELMQQHSVQGASLAVVRQGRLVLARGYGWADKERAIPMEPVTPARIASITKALALIALDRLILEDKIRLDQNVWDPYLSHLLPAEPADPRLRSILIGHLASHTSGLSGDPRCRNAEPIQRVDATEPPNSHDLVRYFASVMRLRNEPGTVYEYSNPGFLLLGRVMEEAAGEPLEQLIRRLVLEPLGLKRPRLGRSRLEDLATGETSYPDVIAGRRVRSVFPEDSSPVPIAHGGCPLESMEALGGWIASPIEIATVFARTPGVIVSAVGREFTLRRIDRNYVFYGMHAEGHGGIVRRIANGDAFALTFNSSSWNGGPSVVNEDFDRALTRVFHSTVEWPDSDFLAPYLETLATTFPASASPEHFVWTAQEGQPSADVLRLRLDGPDGMQFRINSAALWIRLPLRTSTLPAELEIRADTNGLRAGVYRSVIHIERADFFSDPLSIPVELHVSPRSLAPRTLRILPAGLPPLATGQDVSLALRAEGGTPPYRWSIASGSLPSGFLLDPSSGLISGKAVPEGRHEWVVRVTDSVGLEARRGFSAAIGVPGWLTARANSLGFTSELVAGCDPLGDRAADRFPRSVPRIVAYLTFSGSIAPGDQVIFEWRSPEGSLRQRNVWTAEQGWEAGLWGQGCSYWILNPAQHASAPSGDWTVRVTWNGNDLAQGRFRLE